MEIGQRIKQKREALGLTQRELADLMGYTSHTTINKVENGINDINQSTVLRYASALKTTPGYLMGWEDVPVDLVLSDEEKQIIIDYRKASYEDQTTIKRILHYAQMAGPKAPNPIIARKKLAEFKREKK